MMFGKNRGTDKTWKQIPPRSVGAELGVWKGDSTVKFLKRAKHIHLVDSWNPVSYEDSSEHGNYENYLKRYSELVGGDNPADFARYYEKIYQSVVNRFSAEQVTIHRMTTNEFFARFTDKLDWVYVDASHAYDMCLSDLRNSMRIIKSGGLLLGDDFCTSKPQVMKAVLDFSIETKLRIDNFYESQYKFIIE